MTIEGIYEAARARGLARSRRQFSREYLGRAGNYLSDTGFGRVQRGRAGQPLPPARRSRAQSTCKRRRSRACSTRRARKAAARRCGRERRRGTGAPCRRP